jgi:O-antigen/teichoic acid export membrane protein
VSPVRFRRSPPAGASRERSSAALWRAGRIALQLNAIALACNLISGVIFARTLAPHGRGELTAILTLPNVATWFFGMGASEATSYFGARNPAARRQLLASWLGMMLPLGLVATCAIEILVPVALHAQSAHTIFLARIWAPTVLLPMYAEILYGTLLGDHRYTWYNVARMTPSVAIAAGYLVLWLVDSLTVPSALIVNAIGSLLAIGLMVAIVRIHIGIERPRTLLPRNSLWYGFKAHGVNLSSIVNARLDLIILPAFLAARNVGLYAIATTVSWILVTFAGALYPIVMPMAVKQGERGPQTIARALYAVLAIGTFVGAPLVLFAPPALHVVYGSQFVPAATALRVLIPGSVLFGGTQILWSGLFSINRPFTAAFTQLPGIVLTVVGLLLLLPHYGINAAAVVSTVAYTVVFLLSLHFYARAARLPLRTLLNPRHPKDGMLEPKLSRPG